MNYCELAIELEYLYEELAKATGEDTDIIEREIELVKADYNGDYDNE